MVIAMPIPYSTAVSGSMCTMQVYACICVARVKGRCTAFLALREGKIVEPYRG